MKIDPAVRELLIAFAAKFPVPRTIGGGEAHEQRCREWSIAFCEQVAYSRPGRGYGTKRADSGRPISKDTISQQFAGDMVSWDLLIGTGTGEPALNLDPHGELTTGQVFEAVEAVNHLGAVVPPVEPPPVVEPPPDGAIAARFANIEKLLGALEWRHDEQRRELDALKLEVVRIGDRPSAPPDLSGLRAKGSVKVPILGSINVNLPVVKE
jgi:hypothetical protein